MLGAKESNFELQQIFIQSLLALGKCDGNTQVWVFQRYQKHYYTLQYINKDPPCSPGSWVVVLPVDVWNAEM